MLSVFLPPVDGAAVSSHPPTVCFMRRLLNTFSPVLKPTPLWDLNLILSTLTKTPFEPLATCCLSQLSTKVVFLVAITSARRGSELTTNTGPALHPVCCGLESTAQQ